MTDVTWSALLVGVGLAALSMTLIFGVVSDGASRYGVEVPDRYNDTFSDFSVTVGEIGNLSLDMQGKAENEAGVTETGTGVGITKTIVGILKLPFTGSINVIKMVTRAIFVAGDVLGVPDNVTAAILAIFIIVCISIILGVVFNAKT